MKEFLSSKSRAFLFTLTATITGFCFSASTLAREIKVTTVDWPPYYGSQELDYGPLAVITKEALSLSGHSMKIDFLPWLRALSEVKNGRRDILLGAYYTNERNKEFRISDRLYAVKEVIIGLKSTGISEFKSLRNLDQYTFGVTRGYAFSDDFMKADYLKREEAVSDLLNVRKLYNQRIDFVVMDPAVFFSNSAQVPDRVKQEVQLLSPPLKIAGVHNLISREIADSKQLHQDFNKGLKELVLSGRYDEILRAHKLKK